MTVSVTNSRTQGDGNGAATEFAFPFTIFSASDVEVTHVDADGLESTLEQGTGPNAYRVVVPGNKYPSAGKIRYPENQITPMPSGERIIIRRILPLTQDTILNNQGGYFPKVHERQYDRQVMIAQQQQEELDRAIKAPPGFDEGDLDSLIEQILNSQIFDQFVSLEDTPDDYTGHGEKIVRVNAGETALEFVNDAFATQTWAVPHRGALVRLTGNVSPGSWPAIPQWQTAEYDSDGFYSAGNPTRLTIPAGVTKIRLTAAVEFTTTATAGNLLVTFQKNGAASFIGRTIWDVREGGTGFGNNRAFAVTPVLEVTAGDYFEVITNRSDASITQILEGDATYFAIEVVEVSDAQKRPYDVAAFLPGKPGAGALIMQNVFVRGATLPANASGSRGFAGTAATAQADFDVRRNGVSVGTATIAASGTTATFSITETEFAAGDRLQLVAPGSQDATLADLSFSFKLELS